MRESDKSDLILVEHLVLQLQDAVRAHETICQGSICLWVQEWTLAMATNQRRAGIYRSILHGRWWEARPGEETYLREMLRYHIEQQDRGLH